MILTLTRYDTQARKLDPVFTFTAGAATANVKVSASRLTNGVTMRSFTLQKHFADVDQSIRYSGMTPSTLSLNIASGVTVTGSFDFMGMNAANDSGNLLPAEGDASQTYSVMNAITGVGCIQEGGEDLSTFVKSLTLQVDNNLRGKEAVGVLGYADVDSGTLKVTGTPDGVFCRRKFV